MASSAITSFQDPYDFNYQSAYQAATGQQGMATELDSVFFNGESGLPGAMRKLFGQDLDAAKKQRETIANQAYERASIDSARAWSEYMDNTATQRRVKDIEAAGLNPWLAVQNGIAGGSAPSVDTGGTAQQTNHSGQSSTGLLRGLLMVIAGILMKNPKVAATGAVSAASEKVWAATAKSAFRKAG